MMHEKITYNLEASISAAIFSKKPFLVVEGEDDARFYKKISEKKINILPSELVKKKDNTYYQPGCNGVINIVEDVQALISKNEKVKNYFIGIIDRDCRKYVENDIELPCLFKLNFYSYESHFMTRSSVINFIQHITCVPKDDISEQILDLAMDKTDGIARDLYYVALEALKGRCNSTYNRLVTYETKPETIYQVTNGEKLIDKVLEKKSDLDLFAQSKSISFDNVKNIIKGKWYLYAFCMKVHSNIIKLTSQCRDNIIEQCNYCRNDKFDKCLWKIKIEVRRSEFVECIINLNYKDECEIEYIKDTINMLGQGG